MIELTPFMSITLISLGLSLIISIIYRVLTNPDTVRKAKEDMRFYKGKVKEAQREGDKEKISQYSSEMLKASQVQFRLSMKPMIATMFIFFLLLGWLHNNFGGVTVDLKTDPDAKFAYGSAEHDVYLEYADVDGQAGMKVGIDFNDDGSFSEDEVFRENSVFRYEGAFWRPVPATEGFLFFASPREGSVHFEMLIARMPFTLPFIGSYLSWFWWYIFVSLPATIIFRKMLGVE